MLRPINCPCCGAEIRRDKIDTGKPFPCPSCRKALRVPSYYYPIPGVGALFICVVLGYILAPRSWSLLILVALLWFPLTIALYIVLKLKFNPKVTEYRSDDLDLSSQG